ncbi:DUF6542 domain-containing protein, partial [Streptomyces palmae]|uniref:DUF6542 domain-containing protein n=1 Tax=Streptomyces palmae TaxID=1701085 RepID=UPI001ADF2123
MEHHSTRTPHRAAAPSPRPAADDASGQGGGSKRRGAVRRTPGRHSPALSSLVAALRRLPSPRLTGFGVALLAALSMVAVGCLVALLLSGSPAVYGVCFVLVSAACGLWVRPADLLLAPTVVPIAFVLGLLPINDSEDGAGAQAIAVFTSLSLHAAWLYAGTLVTGLIVVVRRAVLVSRRRQRRPERSRGPRPGQAQRASRGDGREREKSQGRRPRPGQAPGQGPRP